LPRGTGVGCVTNRVQWNIIAYDADGNPKVSGCAASGCDFHYFDQKSVTPRERIESLLTWVKTDMAAGILNQGNGKRLTAKLNAALGNLASANTQRAIKELKAFLDEVDAIVKSGRFSKAAAQPLIDEAVEIIADVGG